MCLLGIGKNEPRFLAVPVASELVFIGPVGPSHSHAPRSGRRLNLQSTGTPGGSNGLGSWLRAVVRTTDAMVIHSAGATYRERPKIQNKCLIVFSSMRVFVFGELERPGIERTRVAGWQSQTVACGGDDETLRLVIPRVRTPVFQGNRRRAGSEGRGGPLPTREGRDARRNGPRRHTSRLGVLSGKPSGAPIGPRHPEISGGLRRLQRRVHRDLGAFWVVVPRILGKKPEIERRGTLKSCDIINAVL